MKKDSLTIQQMELEKEGEDLVVGQKKTESFIAHLQKHAKGEQPLDHEDGE
ncbi:hypothetical protein FOPG_14940 [Fusarium oxysporum f. sp. conglutinans race 2 54008]|uniref:Uncharacterized protein n=1 Tax=Fusarium oxysporum f. sp. conglutinans race 2 54008 TaxID=1089457 RepID=X0HB05_FUSOX|nr:hypothetical protein FOPG_14940 [Fusarium oxysporum f. sp. conglutinans race 2 54008]